MSDKTYRHAAHSVNDNTDNVPVPIRDESDGTFSPVARSRMEVWDGQNWIRLRANAKGALTFDRGNAGAELSVSNRYVGAQSGTVLVSADSTQTIHVTAMLVTLDNSATLSPGAQIKLASMVVGDHPGIPAGGGFSWSDLDVSGSAGDDLTFSCDNPSGTIAVTVHYWIET